MLYTFVAPRLGINTGKKDCFLDFMEMADTI